MLDTCYMKWDPFDPDWMGLSETKADHNKTIYISPCYCHRTTGSNISRTEHKLHHCRRFQYHRSVQLTDMSTPATFFYNTLQGEMVEFYGLTLSCKQLIPRCNQFILLYNKIKYQNAGVQYLNHLVYFEPGGRCL
jgi:hypothetical protein